MSEVTPVSPGRLRPAPRRSAKVAGRPREEWQADLDVERTLGWLFNDIHRLLAKAFESRIKGMGLTRSQWRVLLAVDRAPGGHTQTEIAELTAIEKAPLGKILDKLEEAGWIVRKNDPDDRRARLVYATSKIDRFIPELAAAAKGTFALTLQGMRQGEVKDLIAKLQKLKRNLGGEE